MDMQFVLFDWRRNKSDLGVWHKRYWSQNRFIPQHDLDLWPTDLKINKVHLLVVNNW